MGTLLAILFFIFTWFAFVALASAHLSIENYVDPLPNGAVRGTSIFPGIPIAPAISTTVYLMLGPAGRQITIWIHVAILGLSICYAAYVYSKLLRLKIRDRMKLTRLQRVRPLFGQALNLGRLVLNN